MPTENTLRTVSPAEPDSAKLVALVAGAGLGSQRAVYRPARHNGLVVLGALIMLIPVPVLLAAPGRVGGVLLALLIWPLGVLVLRKSPGLNRDLAQWRVYVFDNGFLHVGKRKSAEVYRWDQITTVYQAIVNTRYNGISTGTRYLYTITRADGKTAKLTQAFGDIGKLGREISVRVSEAQLPAVKAALAQGRQLWFGDIFVDSASVGTARRAVPWSSISDVQIRNGQISLVQTGKFLPLTRTRAAKVPNLPLFLHLARTLQGGSR